MSPSLQELHEKFETALASYSSSLPKTNLYEPIKYILGLGGKRIRPILALLSAKLYQASEEQSISAALAIEIFHNFSLVHDDIMDLAPLRRGKETVHKKWDDNAAILSGDAMLIEAYKQLAKIDSSLHGEVLKLFNDTSLEVCEGQQRDMDFEERDDVTVQEYVDMISLKTAVLLGCSLKMGAIIGKASSQEADLLYDFGKSAGIAFQIQDDYLDAFGDPVKFGKQVGGDILSNKKTFLILHALKEANTDDREELKKIYFEDSMNDPEEKVRRVKELFSMYGVDSFARSQSEFYFKEAISALEKLEFTTEEKSGFYDFLDLLRFRKT
jgi:geranylgeranyl diphosphate synthase type II